ncbi:MAG: hypothetical protein JW836_06685 [Deltaproteobacteria bacterium]|nr:hypothetical protein [Deltaproteobacteria bacterium]
MALNERDIVSLEVPYQPVSRLKKIVLWGIVGALFYFFLSHHIIFVGSKVKVLKKSNLTLEYTIFSTQGKSYESIIRVDQLRRDGIGELLVEMGKLSQGELDRLLDKYRR